MALFIWLRQGKAAFRLVALPAVLSLILVACGNASGGGGGGSQTQGVISKEIALAYATNPTNLALRFTDEPETAAQKETAEGESMLSMLE